MISSHTCKNEYLPACAAATGVAETRAAAIGAAAGSATTGAAAIGAAPTRAVAAHIASHN